VLDFEKQKISYGDSMHEPMNIDLQIVLTWWIGYHTGRAVFDHNHLSIMTQTDTYLCRMLVWNALQFHFLPKKHQLWDIEHVNNSWLYVFLRLVRSYQTEKVPLIYISTKNQAHQIYQDTDIYDKLEVEEVMMSS
jgi:hypothetical protein